MFEMLLEMMFEMLFEMLLELLIEQIAQDTPLEGGLFGSYRQGCFVDSINQKAHHQAERGLVVGLILISYFYNSGYRCYNKDLTGLR